MSWPQIIVIVLIAGRVAVTAFRHGKHEIINVKFVALHAALLVVCLSLGGFFGNRS